MSRAPDPAALARMIDISAVQAQHTETDVRALAQAALAGNYVAAHVLPAWVPLLRELLDGSTTNVGAPVGFPSGGSATAVKVAEARWLVAAGVDELDVVVNVGRLRSGQDAWVTDDLRAVFEEVAGRVPMKVIMETAHLDDDALRRGCAAALAAGARSVKTGTGWAGHTTTVREVGVIREEVGPGVEIKASGRIRGLAVVRELLAAGATRFGMNAAAAASLLEEAAVVGEVGQ